MRVKEGFIPVEEGLRLYYSMVGDGPETVIIPAASWLVADFEPLVQGRTLLFYDQRNRGRSDAVQDTSRIGINYEVQDLEVIRQHLELERLALIGWSYLGRVVALYTMEHPERVNRLVLLCSASPSSFAYEGQKSPAEIEARVDQAALKRLGEMSEAGLDTSDPASYCREFWKVNLPRQMGNPASALARMRSDPCACSNEWPINFFPYFGRLRNTYEEYDWRPRLAALEIPTLVIHGLDDLIPLESSREWAAALPEARLFVIPGSGHYPWLEQPEAFFPAVDRFLAGSWPEGAIEAKESRN